MTVTIESASQGDHHFVEITIDDGLLNVLDLAAVSSIGEGFDLAVAAGHPVVLAGRSGAFTAGLDLKVLRTGGEPAAELLDAMAAVLVQAVELPVPLVAAVNGPAIAAGAMLCLAADHVVMAAGDHQIGFSEVRQGLPLPGPAVELAREFLAADALLPATAHAVTYSPVTAAAVGFVDTVVAPSDVVPAAREAAARLGTLPSEAYAATKQLVRAPLLARMRAALGG